MKIKEVTVGRSGVIPVAAYENLRPSYSITAEVGEGESHQDVIVELDKYLQTVFDHASNAAKAELLAQQYAGLRLYEKNGRQYPSVTSILNYGKEWRVTEDELSQYASRGTIVGEMVETFLKTGTWLDPTTVPALAEDVSVLLGGSLNMGWDQCSHRAFCEKYAKEIQVEAVQGTVFNDEALYAGTFDVVGTYEGKRSLMDVKCGGWDMRQLAAYAVCCDDIERLVILPVGPTDNKCGYKKPVVCTTIQKEYEEFLKARAKFRLRFGL